MVRSLSESPKQLVQHRRFTAARWTDYDKRIVLRLVEVLLQRFENSIALESEWRRAVSKPWRQNGAKLREGIDQIRVEFHSRLVILRGTSVVII